MSCGSQNLRTTCSLEKGPTEICWDSTAACFIGNDVIETIELDDDGEGYTCGSDYSESDSDLDAPFTSEDLSLCEEGSFEDAPYPNRKRRLNVQFLFTFCYG